MSPGRFALLAATASLIRLAGCAPAALSPPARRVFVYQAPLDATPVANRLPAGCEEVARQPPVRRTELTLAGVADLYEVPRDLTAAAGGNVLLVLTRLIVPRQCTSCPAASPITDCPPCEGAWFDVVFASYTCTARALAELPPERLP